MLPSGDKETWHNMDATERVLRNMQPCITVYCVI
jgi:hypothetical protein